MDNIKYLWKFKPNEKNKFPQDVIVNNLKFIEKYKIVTPNIIEPFINNAEFPNLLNLYLLIPHWVVKSDLIRLLIIYFNGGMYSDADCFIQKPFNNHVDNHNIILFTERTCNLSDLGSRECKNPENALRVANFCFGSKTTRHPFFKEVIDECINRLTQLLLIEQKKKFNNNDVLWVCGPDVITTIYHKSKKNYNDIYLCDNTYLNHKCYGSWR